MWRRDLGRWALGMWVVIASVGLGTSIGWGAERAPTPEPGARPASPPRIEDFAPPQEFVMAGGIKTHFVSRGTKGRPIVFIHGFGCNTSTWERNLDPLAGRFRVYALDLKGFGLSAKPRDGRYHLEAFAEHVLGFLDAMKLERPILVGNSMGGAVAARVALLHPDRVGGVVLVDAIPVAFPRPALPLGRPGLARSADPKGPPGALSAFARALITRQTVASALRKAFHDPALVTEAMIETNYRPITFDGAAEALVAMMNPPPEPSAPLPPLAALEVPTLVAWGRYDRLVPQAIADLYARAVPGARKVVFENSGHFPHYEEPDAFNRLIAEFVSQTP